MTIDLSFLTPLLAQLGPWGYLIAALVPVVAMLLKQKYAPSAPASPTDPPKTAPETPILDAILKALGKLPKGKPGTFDDLSHEDQKKFQAELDKVAAWRFEKATREANELLDLKLVDPPK